MEFARKPVVEARGQSDARSTRHAVRQGCRSAQGRRRSRLRQSRRVEDSVRDRTASRPLVHGRGRASPVERAAQNYRAGGDGHHPNADDRHRALRRTPVGCRLLGPVRRVPVAVLWRSRVRRTGTTTVHVRGGRTGGDHIADRRRGADRPRSPGPKDAGQGQDDDAAPGSADRRSCGAPAAHRFSDHMPGRVAMPTAQNVRLGRGRGPGNGSGPGITRQARRLKGVPASGRPLPD